MYKSCSRCGKIHDTNYKCNKNKTYIKNELDKLRSTYKWTRKAEEIKKASNYLCAICKDLGVYNYADIECHHIIKLQDDPSKFLDNDNLIVLCRYHHKQADEGKIEIDYLLKLAKEREDN